MHPVEPVLDPWLGEAEEDRYTEEWSSVGWRNWKSYAEKGMQFQDIPL